MYGDGRNGSMERARREQKALERKAKRQGRELSGNDKARYERVRGTREALAVQSLYQDDND